jgi:hypothetical protein
LQGAFRLSGLQLIADGFLCRQPFDRCGLSDTRALSDLDDARPLPLCAQPVKRRSTNAVALAEFFNSQHCWPSIGTQKNPAAAFPKALAG